MENWKAVVGYEGFYEVSDLGNVRSIKRRPGSHCGPMRGVLIKGYRRVILNRNAQPKRYFIHQLVVTAFIGEILKGMQPNHKNGIKTDNRLENLEIVTASQNRFHSHRVLGNKGPIGSSHGRAKLTESQVLDIRRLDKEGMSRKELSAQFSIGPQMLSFIINRKNWRHI